MTKGGKTFLVIGRFQPFHKGHLFLLKSLSCGNSNFLKIAVGVSENDGKSDGNNPFVFKDRKRMLENSLLKEGISRFKILEIPDRKKDVDWLALLLTRAGDFDCAVSGNPWVSGIFRGASLPFRGHRFLKRGEYSGTNVRALLRKSPDKAKRLMTKEAFGVVKQTDFGREN